MSAKSFPQVDALRPKLENVFFMLSPQLETVLFALFNPVEILFFRAFTLLLTFCDALLQVELILFFISFPQFEIVALVLLDQFEILLFISVNLLVTLFLKSTNGCFTLSHIPSSPFFKPSIIYPPISIITVDGECILNAFLNPSINGTNILSYIH